MKDQVFHWQTARSPENALIGENFTLVIKMIVAPSLQVEYGNFVHFDSLYQSDTDLNQWRFHIVKRLANKTLAAPSAQLKIATGTNFPRKN